VPLLAVGAVVSSSPWIVTPTVWQKVVKRTSTAVPPHVPVFVLNACTAAPAHETPVGEPHEHPLHARESLTPP
jgi:NADPH-dependent 2,4-dienoyl-CoA reductase/sulfur reductase-like enzyme